ncbi:hypothetical protein T484DRAFT_1789354 [Baffinella frigidus]|nr:hypothetical protein T484DRAFT_1789354 [Cryptophyta sp. CCMP2293]
MLFFLIFFIVAFYMLYNLSTSTIDRWCAGMLFFLIFFIVAFYMLYNLFIGVIVQEFELNEDQKEGMQLGYFRVKASVPKP